MTTTVDGSDYGSDLDEATLNHLFSQSESQPTFSATTSFEVAANIEQPVILDDHGDSIPLARLARVRDNLVAAITGLDEASDALKPKGPVREASFEVEYDEGNRNAFSRKSHMLGEVIVVKLTR